MRQELGQRRGCTVFFPIPALIVLGLLLSGCAHSNMPASVQGGECRVFQDPGFRVRGLRAKDNRWIASTQETGIRVCGWHRPAPESFSCSDVRELVRAFGSLSAAESYARLQGATEAQLRVARSCLPTASAPPPTPTARAIPVRAQVAPVAAPRPAVVASPPKVAPTRKARERWYQFWRPKQ